MKKKHTIMSIKMVLNIRLCVTQRVKSPSKLCWLIGCDFLVFEPTHKTDNKNTK